MNVEVEQRNDFSDLQPDLVGVTEDGERIHIEILNTHKVDSVKESKLRDRKQACMEIDVSKQSLDNLKDFLLTTGDERKWVNHPEYDEEERKARDAAYERDKANKEMSEREILEAIKRMSELAANTRAYNFDENERYYEESTPSPQNNQNMATTAPAKVIEPPKIVHNEATGAILEKFRKERIVKDSNDNTYYVEMCEPTRSGKYVVARGFDRDYEKPGYHAHILLIYEFQGNLYTKHMGREKGEFLYSAKYCSARDNN